MGKLINARTGVAALALVGAGLLPAATATAQSTATLAVNKACYVVARRGDATITLTGSGYGPGDQVTITDTQGIDTTVTASTTGTIVAAVPAPGIFLAHPGAVVDKITAEDFNTGATGTTTTSLTALDVANTGTRKAPGLRALTEMTTWTFSGFPSGRVIWGHYLWHNKLLARQSFGRAQGPCGELKVRRRFYPATPHHQAYTIQVDASKHYSPKTRPSLRRTLQLTFF